jgi:arabinofuranan 3-O-arabinosyltransferase
MVYYAWVDLPAIALFAVWLALRRAHPVWAALAVGMSLAAKPSAAPALLVMFAWVPRIRREVVGAVVIAVLVTAPFVIATGAAAFYMDVVGNLADQPARLDSLTLDSFLHAAGYAQLPGVVAAILVVAAAGAVLLHRPASLRDCLVGGAAIAIAAFLFAKVAYLNYYDTAAVFLLLALAVSPGPAGEPVAARLLGRAQRAHGAAARVAQR